MRDREPARTLTARTAPASTPEAGVLLQLALDGSDIDCVAATGWSRAQVIQAAIRVAHDPEVAALHPAEAARVVARVRRQTMARREAARRLRERL